MPPHVVGGPLVKHFGTIRAVGNEPRLVGLREPVVSPARIFAPPPAFAPKPHLAYDGDNGSRNGKKEAPS
jgi:hypothetical protein